MSQKTVTIQVVLPEEFVAFIDNHAARLKALCSAGSTTRSSIARSWMEEAFPRAEQKLRSQEDAVALLPRMEVAEPRPALLAPTVRHDVASEARPNPRRRR